MCPLLVSHRTWGWSWGPLTHVLMLYPAQGHGVDFPFCLKGWLNGSVIITVLFSKTQPKYHLFCKAFCDYTFLAPAPTALSYLMAYMLVAWEGGTLIVGGKGFGRVNGTGAIETWIQILNLHFASCVNFSPLSLFSFFFFCQLQNGNR